MVSGIDQAALRLVAQCLKQARCRMPLYTLLKYIKPNAFTETKPTTKRAIYHPTPGCAPGTFALEPAENPKTRASKLQYFLFTMGDVTNIASFLQRIW
jgi:hypothetical protein